MPTIQVDLIEVKEKLNTDNIIFTARQDDRIITREIDRSEFDTWEKFADWLINQEPEFILLPDKEKSLSIIFHTETVTDPDSGIETIIRIVDEVVVT